MKDTFYYKENKNDEIEENNGRSQCDRKKCDCCVLCVNCSHKEPENDLNFADFYALIPPNDATAVVPGVDVAFPQNGPIGGKGIVRLTDTTFKLVEIGTYQVFFEVTVNEIGQLILTLNGADLAYTVVGRSTGTSQIIGMALVRTTVANSVLTVRNPSGNTNALTLTPNAGGQRAVSAHLIITQIE